MPPNWTACRRITLTITSPARTEKFTSPPTIPTFSRHSLSPRAMDLRRRLWEAFESPSLPQESRRAHRHDADALRDRDAARLLLLGRLQRGRQDDRKRQEYCQVHPAAGCRHAPDGASASSPCCWRRSGRPIPGNRDPSYEDSSHLPELVRRSNTTSIPKVSVPTCLTTR